MTRTWEEAARNAIEERVENALDFYTKRGNKIYEAILEFKHSVPDEDEEVTREDVEELEEQIDDIAEMIAEFSRDGFEQAGELKTLKSRDTIRRNLRGEEQVGYSKRDGGVAHDATYGSKVMSNNFAENLSWRINLDEWDKTKAETTKSDSGKPVRGTVSAEGMVKFHKYIGGRDVHIVIGEREPPI